MKAGGSKLQAPGAMEYGLMATACADGRSVASAAVGHGVCRPRFGRVRGGAGGVHRTVLNFLFTVTVTVTVTAKKIQHFSGSRSAWQSPVTQA